MAFVFAALAVLAIVLGFTADYEWGYGNAGLAVGCAAAVIFLLLAGVTGFWDDIKPGRQ